ncbi:hypothetical protein [Roseimicrobium sp. ORNL1]|uniref:hypothetical protein n=1 Tax=Roseimicrobium sp. ORNL1 TaxID=2711231 RepID=UPI0013E0F250|nr:hypothetical protein [Roseimicrobium sp. ORNL1]QIF03147.1 hypothetical protein G5S37_16995 [Roseimicrobium sp. ORNL1]
MNLRRFAPFSLSFAFVTACAIAADPPKLPSIPAEPTAKKKELLFSDDFERTELNKAGEKAWAIVVPTFSLENGTLKGMQMRFDAPAANGKPAVKGHQAVLGNDIPTKDSVIEFRFRLGTAQSVTAEYDDRKFNGSHYGHLCMARIAADKIILVDQKGLAVARPEGATGEPPTPAGRKNVTFPLSLDTESWHTFMLETVGDTMRATIDGKPVAFLQSPGIAHPTKSKVEFGCMGQGGFFDDLKIWNAEPSAVK